MKHRTLAATALGAGILLAPAAAFASNLDTGTVTWSNIGGNSNAFCTSNNTSFHVSDVAINGGLSDGFDGGANTFIDAIPYDGAGTTTPNGYSVTGGSQSMSGLDVVVDFTTAANASWLRQTITLTNPSASAIDVTVRVESNSGADDGATVNGTGDGWFAAAAGSTDADLSGDVPLTFLTHGTTASDKAVLKNDCGLGETALSVGSMNSDIYSAIFPLHTVAAGETVRYVLFYAASPNIADSIAFGANTDQAAATAAGLFEGMTDADLATVVNWSFTSAPSDNLPTTGASNIPFAMTALGLALAGAFLATLRRRTA